MSYNNMTALYFTTLRYMSIGFLFSPFLAFALLYIVFVIRELYISNASLIATVCCGIILSEFLLFVGFFWGAYNCILSSTTNMSFLNASAEGLLAPSCCGLILVMTLLLASASVSISYGDSLIMKGLLGSNYTFVVLITGFVFTCCQALEYMELALYINDTSTGTYFFILTGLHFSHVIVGIVLLYINFWNGGIQYQSLRNTIYCSENGSKLYTQNSYVVLPQMDLFCLLYWHFLELIWIGIQFTLYTF